MSLDRVFEALSSTVRRKVLEAGLQCYPLSDYTIATPRPGALILGYAGVPADRMGPHLLRLADALAGS